MNKGTGKDDGRRAFDFYVTEDEVQKYYIGMPSSEQIRKADWHYSKVYNKALVEGIATQSEMMTILRERNIYGEDYERRLEELQIAVAKTIKSMDDEKDELEKAKLALEVKQLRDELYRWNQKITGPLSNTCEQMADDAKTEYLTSCVVQKEDGTLVWETHEDFVSEENQRLVVKSRFEVLLWMQGLESDFLENTPENTVLKELAESQRQKTEMLKLKAAQAADAEEEAAPVEKVPAKKGRKRRAPRKKAGTKKS